MGYFLKPSGENLTGSFCSGIKGTQDRSSGLLSRKFGVLALAIGKPTLSPIRPNKINSPISLDKVSLAKVYP